MKNIKLIISYDGTRYNGWQKQGNTNNTIQGKVEETIKKFIGEEIEIAGSGRTDAGVHALAQVANFKMSDKTAKHLYDIHGINDNHIKSDGYVEKSVYLLNGNSNDEIYTIIRDELNQYLPQDIRILDVCEVEERFHARLNAKGKHYSYRIDNGKVARIFDRKYVTRIDRKLDVERMRQASLFFIGKHDFKSFCTNKKMKKSTVRTIDKINIAEDNGIIKMDFYGNGFLYNMIRIIVGTLIEVGLYKREPNEMETIINSLDRSKAGHLAPATGLFLEEVYY